MALKDNWKEDEYGRWTKHYSERCLGVIERGVTSTPWYASIQVLKAGKHTQTIPKEEDTLAVITPHPAYTPRLNTAAEWADHLMEALREDLESGWDFHFSPPKE